ncbi:MAG: Alanine-tRNA ligase [Parcubacteria group bacterium GW2011_GWB1_36_5]|nr:MAG: Alanine-tRNA ligase [Parcubacteria group bacterium GW2011_GWA2_36_24]KKQ07208.1 MAG: Alanine-tRNA ligase [Parcubacteria group bacterium GW2011_GWB1_36_5]
MEKKNEVISNGMQSDEIRSRFLKFFENRGHKIIPSASLVPENDPSVLFTTAGMQQFKHYYTNPESADKDFGGRNIVTAQKCIRTGDIDEVGDATHLTFFEMLGNFSFGGYGRREAVEYAHDFIVKELGLEISYVTFYKGSKNVPKDEESEKIWKEIGIKDVKEEGEDVFWGPTGDSGPCGPTTEIYCKNADGEDVEIWNIVFNEYFCEGSREKLDKGEAKLKKLDVLGIDTGMGFERLLATAQKKKSVYETDVFNNEKTKEERIVADHIKASLFIISDGVMPSNTGAGYILRRLIRRAVRFSKQPLAQEVEKIKKIYEGVYVFNDKGEIEKEEIKFRQTLEHGLKEFEKDTDPFILFTTYGFPIELTLELAKEKGKMVDLEDFNKKMAEHQKLSQTSSVGMFKGGLANHNEKTIKLHTAHHLLLAALKAVIDPNIKQRGSNITEERLRIDFLCDHRLTDEEKKKVEDWVNDKIKQGLIVTARNLPLHFAQKIGAEMEFGAKYPDMVSVYFIGLGENYEAVSKEFCGGPHVTNTSELGTFKIQKEEAVAKGIRRIKAILK